MKSYQQYKNVGYVLLLASLLIMGSSCAQQDFESASPIPDSVIDKYLELHEAYKDSLGVRLEHCSKNGEELYVVAGSGGFSGFTYYLDSNGSYVDSYRWSDSIEYNAETGERINPPPIDLSEFTCEEISVSPDVLRALKEQRASQEVPPPKTPEEKRLPIVEQKAAEYVKSKTGETFFQEYITVEKSYWVKPVPQAAHLPSLYYVWFNVAHKDIPALNETINIQIQYDAKLPEENAWTIQELLLPGGIGVGRISGIPPCLEKPESCEFPITEEEVIALANASIQPNNIVGAVPLNFTTHIVWHGTDQRYNWKVYTPFRGLGVPEDCRYRLYYKEFSINMTPAIEWVQEYSISEEDSDGCGWYLP